MRRPGEPATIVLADDTEDLRVLVRSVLERAGDFEVVGEAGDGREAVRLVHELRPRLLLLDLSMPELDGLEVLPRVRTLSPETEVVIFTGFDPRTFRADALARGGSAYLQKGIPLSDLVRRIRSVIGDAAESDTARRRPPRTPTDPVLNAMAAMAHELRTPIAVASGFAELLHGIERLGQERRVHATRAIGRAMQQLTSIIESSLDAHRIDAGALELDRAVVDIGWLVRETVTDLSPLIAAQEVEVVGEAGSPVSVDPQRVRQVIVNLVTNAFKFAGPAASVGIAITRHEDTVAVAVTDSGPGVTEGDEEAIFDRFWQADGGGKGVGLGLHVARSIARAHGGDLVHERPEGGGARFVLSLPVMRRAPVQASS